MTTPLLVLERAVALHVALDGAEIPHAFGGALALAYHVQDARGTNDIDLNVTMDADAPQALFAALPAGLPWSDADIEVVRRDGQVRLYWPHPDGPPIQPTPVDLFLPQDELHAVVAARVEHVPLLNTTVPVLTATDLTIFKALFDRRKDWADIEELLRYGDVEAEEVERWLTQLLEEDDARVSRFRALVQEVQLARSEPIAADIFGRRKPRLGD